MLNTMIVAAVTNFSGTTTPDKNGETPIMLQCIAGTMPNRNVLSGTVGRRTGLEVGRTYLINVRETGYDDVFGQDFTFVKVMELVSGLDIVRAAKELGDPKIVTVNRPEGFDQMYKRKGDAVEGQRTKRIKEGAYHPIIPTSVAHHETASGVRTGSSVGSGGEILHVPLPGEEGYQEGEGEFPEPQDQYEDQENFESEDESEQQQPENLTPPAGNKGKGGSKK